MHSFATEIDAMRAAQLQLAQYRETLEQYRGTAAGLKKSVPKSRSSIHDPVADKLHEVFADRAHHQGGLQGVLDDYLRELDKIQNTIKVSLDAYTAAERDAAARYRMTPGEAH